MGEQRKPDVDDVRKSSGSLHSGKQVRDPSDIRVAVYSCTAADYEENHKKLYNSDIKNHPHWKITEIYMDKSASGINRAYYEEFSRMMEDARSGKIDYIVSKSAFRFARNLKETLNCVREFRQLNPPVGVYFKKENIDTLDATGELLMTVISVLAQDERFNTTGNIDKAFRTEDGELDLERLLGHKLGENG